MPDHDPSSPGPLRLHIGGTAPKEGWRILNIQPGPHVDFVGTATDLSAFADGTVDEVYGSHIYEHLSYNDEVMRALAEVFRILRPGGVFMVGVPDLDVLCQLFVHPQLTREEKYNVMRTIYGGQTDPFDFHKGGYNFDILGEFLFAAGFREISRVEKFGLFDDTTALDFAGISISLNVRCVKPPGPK
ncbi:hypothetical protein PHYC_01077 [Phycisphaerales bacterium]|nr:hypothetical protein PHYC_01077 [Phycisphaerales bacterium]